MNVKGERWNYDPISVTFKKKPLKAFCLLINLCVWDTALRWLQEFSGSALPIKGQVVVVVVVFCLNVPAKQLSMHREKAQMDWWLINKMEETHPVLLIVSGVHGSILHTPSYCLCAQRCTSKCENSSWNQLRKSCSFSCEKKIILQLLTLTCKHETSKDLHL